MAIISLFSVVWCQLIPSKFIFFKYFLVIYILFIFYSALSLTIPQNDRQTILNLNANKVTHCNDTLDSQIETDMHKASYLPEVTGLFKDPLDVLGLYCVYLASSFRFYVHNLSDNTLCIIIYSYV